MKYLMTTPAPAYRLDAHRFALESAFVKHLIELKRLLGPRFSELLIATPLMCRESYERQSASTSVVDERLMGIRLVGLYRSDCSRLEFLKALPEIVRIIDGLVKESTVLHVDFSYDIFRPVGALACVLGRLQHKRVLAIDDIDRRRDAEMRFRMGHWSRRTYLICRFLYDPIRVLLYRLYVKLADLMLFKELGQVRDFGRGAPHVRLILDPNFSADQVVNDTLVEQKIHSLGDPVRPLRLMYFGRLVAYKGVDRMIQAVALAHRAGAHLTLDIMGSGEQHKELLQFARQSGVDHLISWIAPVSYGSGFFEVLRHRDMLMACPLSGDTPRSAWDALASGMPLIAFDTDFYRSMADYSGAVELTPWPNVESMAQRLVALARDKKQLAPRIRRAVAIARANTSETWMGRRNDWVQELCAK